MNFNYGIINQESINDLEQYDIKRTINIDGWTKYRITQIATEYDVNQTIIIQAFIQAMLTKYEYDNDFKLEFEDRDKIKEYYRMKRIYDSLLKRNANLDYKCRALERKLNKYI